MNVELHELFPVPVVKFTDVFSIKQLNDIYRFLLSQDHHFSYHEALGENSTSTFYKSSRILELLRHNLPSCHNIVEIIQETILKYGEIIGVDAKIYKLNNSWVNIQQKDSILKMHDHPYSSFSGALYVNADSNSSKLYFEDLSPYKTTFLSFETIKEPTRYNGNAYFFEPQNGDMILFPSLLRHGSYYQKNQTDNRMVISFNAGRCVE